MEQADDEDWLFSGMNSALCIGVESGAGTQDRMLREINRDVTPEGRYHSVGISPYLFGYAQGGKVVGEAAC